jgi:dinuclear metal center YbgI/SA1388 family protein
MKVSNIYEFLTTSFPPETACDFDNVGLLIGDGEAEVKKVLVSLDCNKKTVEAAKSAGCNLIITHHPVIFSPLKNVLSGSIVFELIRAGISVISMHTNLDIAKNGGVNSCLCKALGIENTEIYSANDGYALQFGYVAPTTADDFANRIKTALGGCVKYVDCGKEIQKVLVCSGSGGDFVYEAIKGGFDALVTADVKHHQFLDAVENNISLFDGGHFNTEDIVIEPLKELLSKEFLCVEFITTHKTDIKYK